jgi:DNA-binding transcriptional LysR family regulator
MNQKLFQLNYGYGIDDCMELTDLRYFYNVAQTRSFARGAELSFVTPPAISKSVKKLENELGVALFIRTTRSVSLTERGEILRDHCRRLFDQVADMRRDLDEADETLRGELRVAANEVFSVFLLPNALARLVREHPGVSPRCFEMVPAQIEHGLREGELDVGFTVGSHGLRDVDRHFISEAAGVLVCGREHPLFDRGVVTTEDLLSYPSVVPRFWQREYLPAGDEFPDGLYPRKVGATTELMLLGVQLTIDGAYLGYFPDVTVSCAINHGELKVLAGLGEMPPFRLEALTRKGSRPRASVLRLMEEMHTSVADTARYTCA